MTKSELKPSIRCDKCRKWIKYNYSHGYGHYCSGRAKEIRKVAYIKFCHINSIQNRDPRFFRVRDLANDLDSASVVYNPTANKLSRKDIKMNNRKREQVKQLVRSIDHAEKRISYFERLKRNDDYDVLIRDNTNNTEPEVIENGYEIINQIVYSYKQSLENYNKELDELLAPNTIENKQHVLPEGKIYPWWKKS